MSSRGLLSELQDYTDCAIRQAGVPALSIAIWHDGELHRAASGVLNIETGVQATVDSLFLIGSVTKVLTASLIMLLVDEGKVELDGPVKRYLRNFHVADPDVTENVTVRHLLSHSSGLIGDSSLHLDDPWNEERGAIGRYVDRCFLMPQVHRQLGHKFSYSNAGYVIAGRLVEEMTGLSWWEAIDRHIFAPLQLSQSLVSVSKVLRFRVAIGHFLADKRQHSRTSTSPYCYASSVQAPAGTTTLMSASDLVTFGTVHLNGGKARSGIRWMSESSIAAMQEAQVPIPRPCRTFEQSWGLGWMLWNCQGVQGFGHGGSTAGQEAFLQIIPDLNCVFALQSNATQPPGMSFMRQVVSDILFDIAGVRSEESPGIRESKDLSRLTGVYQAGAFRFEVTDGANILRARIELENSPLSQTYDLKPVGEDRFAMYPAGETEKAVDHLTFLEPDADGVPKYLFWSYRLHPRISYREGEETRVQQRL